MDDDPYDGWMNQTCGGGGILYFPYRLGFDRRVRGKKFIVTYMLDDEFPSVVAEAHIIKGNNRPEGIKLYGHTKRWAVHELLKERSNWVVDTL